MTQPLPRTYWCHAALDSPAPGSEPPIDITTEAPGQAIEWVRESVRAISPLLDRETFHIVWGWLGDHRAVRAAVVDLRRGKPYTFTVPTLTGRWTWVASPVSVLPIVNRCSASSRRQLGPSAAIAGPGHAVIRPHAAHAQTPEDRIASKGPP